MALPDLIAHFHAGGVKLVYEFTGAGSLALTWLHSVGGSSRTVLEATDRYAAASLADLLGHAPALPVSGETASAMAAAAHLRALRLGGDTMRCIGVGCTATIATDYAKRGDHACHVAVHDGRSIHSLALVLRKGARERAGEETVVAQMVLRAIAAAVGVEGSPLEMVEGEELEESRTRETDAVRLLLHAAARWIAVHPDGTTALEPPMRGVIFSGSFNPLHEGHLGLTEAAARVLDQPFAFELPVVNADKPPLAESEIARRLAQFHGRHLVLLTRAPLFAGKAELFPGCVFAVGYDTAERLVDPRYYGGDSGRDAALAAIASHGCRFIVAGRMKHGVFRTLADLRVPEDFKGMFVDLPDFRSDVSSTAIRAGLK